jgi:LPXTG-site transpeptidase (sortase) family protein
VTAPHEISNGVSGRRDVPRGDAWDLCAEFVQSIVADAQSRIAEENRDDLLEVDWASIWSARHGAPSEELAIGRVVRAASDTARGFAAGRPGVVTAAAIGELERSALLTRSSEFVSEPDTRSQPAIDLVGGAVAAPPDSFVVPPEIHEPFVAVTELVTEPVLRPLAIDSLAVIAPESPVTEEVDATHDHDEATIAATPEAEGSSGQSAHQTVRTRSDATQPSTWYHVFTWTRNVGAIVLLFVGWQLWGTNIAQHQAQDQLQNQFEAAVRAHHVPASAGNGKGLIPATTTVAPAADGSVLAQLQIPAIGVHQYVVEGTTATDLSKGPGHYVGTAVPGQAGNVAIAGHRTTHGAPFNQLGHLMPGNRVILTTTWGEKLTYVVSGTPQIVSPGDVGVLNYFGDNRITLTTCNPEYSSSQRLVVVGKLRQPLGTHVALPTHLVYNVANTGTASWNWSLLPAIGIEVCLLLLLALSYRLFDGWFGSRRKWLILVPLWAAGLYLLFGTLTLFLPTSI